MSQVHISKTLLSKETKENSNSKQYSQQIQFPIIKYQRKGNSKQNKQIMKAKTQNKHPNLIPQSVGCLCVNKRHQLQAFSASNPDSQCIEVGTANNIKALLTYSV